MQPTNTGYCKVTISLPCALIEYADQEAERVATSRSEVIGRALIQARKARRDELAARGYLAFAAEAEGFAADAENAAADWLEREDWGDDRQAR